MDMEFIWVLASERRLISEYGYGKGSKGNI